MLVLSLKDLASIYLASVVLSLAGGDVDRTDTRLEAAVDPRVELLSTVFRLAGHPEYNQPNSASPYAEEVETHFGSHREHAVIKMAQKLRAEHGVSYDAVMSMAVHLTDPPALREQIPFDQSPPRLDQRWKAEEARLFVDRLRDFVAETRFMDFYARHRKLYASAADRMERRLTDQAYVKWFDGFFGQRRGADFKVLIGMLNGGCCYGVGVRYPDGREEIRPVIGVWEFDDDGIPEFGAGITGTVVHELCHSYTNPLVDQHEEALEASGKRIYSTCAATMQSQAYGNWKTVVYESMVRACVVRFMHDTAGATAAQQQAAREHGRGFKWVGKLAEELGRYQHNRQRYETIDHFMPEVVAFFETYAEELPKATDVPTVVSMTPANGAQEVDPGLVEIRVTFDRPMMDGGWSVVGGGPHFPEINGSVGYDDACQVFTIPVKLKPNWSYTFWLNRGQFDSFRSASGAPLPPVEVKFRTRGR